MCGQELLGEKYSRHTLYHTFHTKLKSIAPLVKNAGKVTQCCMLDKSSVNVIPDLPEQLACGWNSCTVSREAREVYVSARSREGDYVMKLKIIKLILVMN